MLRLLFEKTGNGMWISHLDLMRVFQRAFRRAGLALRHTEGYNPHAFVSIVLPLSVGASSQCEILEFELSEPSDLAALPQRLNKALPDGIHCLSAWEGLKKTRELTYLQARVTLEYDRGVPGGAVEAMTALLAREALVVEKRSKKGDVELDIRPMLKEALVRQMDENTIEIEAVVCAQNPSLNPALLVGAVRRYLPEMAPDFSLVHRLEVYDGQMAPFR